MKHFVNNENKAKFFVIIQKNVFVESTKSNVSFYSLDEKVYIRPSSSQKYMLLSPITFYVRSNFHQFLLIVSYLPAFDTC